MITSTDLNSSAPGRDTSAEFCARSTVTPDHGALPAAVGTLDRSRSPLAQAIEMHDALRRGNT